MNICPTGALFKRRDGIVDLNGDSCIGCRACMAACPYDQLFIDPNTRTAEKCNFCANRIENKLEPACVSVCPTECRIFGDLDDPATKVAQIVQREAFTVRKPEKGTGPKIFYLQADDSIMRPEIATRPFMFKEGGVHLRPLGALEPDPKSPGDPRVDYDVPHKKAWGIDLVLYLLTKGISTGALFIGAVLWFMGDRSALAGFAAPLVSAVFSALTAVVLVMDLERPERFYFILTRPNWTSWMARGAFILTAHGAIAGLWLLAWLLDAPILISVLAILAMPVALAATAYTGLLFAQGLARDLWQGPHATIDLVAQAAAEGSAALLITALFINVDSWILSTLAWTVAGATALHFMILVSENLLATSPTLLPVLAVRAIRNGAYAPLFWIGALGLGGLAPLVFFAVAMTSGFSLTVLIPMAVVTLAGSLAWEYIWVEAGQCVPIS